LVLRKVVEPFFEACEEPTPTLVLSNFLTNYTLKLWEMRGDLADDFLLSARLIAD